ncbi:hypothetical protein [Nocardia seriolae]|uniref:Uncharacterized protein n=1 Tax=Nocardia seriolae TaxID=37332 RepID=A0A0B8NQN9_9NOCA|nr:hypothetical protein [Nocardia seriolae]APA97082.1 hypothetical protein NS506_03025 [Nocardia seriolae]MTJ65119.1 hypothetical protein [Nocardia seriolae]MTJ76515.1 hypothetical protein [Nocardia seriolae]MTJ86957.1 hypothetical protein [Nocardia seriolae]MTK30952.1 hypothetical protein [Nocardia seriolae]
MRNYFGAHVSGTEHDEVHATTWVYGSFEVEYREHIDRVCVRVRRQAGFADMSMQLTTAQAKLLRELIDAGISDAEAVKTTAADVDSGDLAVSAGDSGGDDNEVDDAENVNDDDAASMPKEVA